jgi:hypothetical protein
LAELNGYRRDLWNLLKSSGYDIDFVGSLSNGDPDFADKQHEGHPGWQDDEIADDVYRFLTDHPAQIVLLHIGTNDIARDPTYTDPADVENILDEIDRWEAEKNKTVVVILAEIINQKGHVCPNSSTTTTFNNRVNEMAQKRTDDRIVTVDMECSAGLNYLSDMADTLHPNSSGYAKMADKWFVDGLLIILPQASAGSDQSVDEKTLVTLNGSGSNDPDGALLDFWWEQQSGTSVNLSDSSAQKPTFTSPGVGSGGERLSFKLTVTDVDGLEHSDTIFVEVNNVLIPPSADAGSDQSVTAGRTVTLDGANSHDPDGTLSSVQWEQVSGNNQVILMTPNELTTEFIAPAVDSDGDILTFKLTIMDNDDLVSSDTVTTNVAVPVVPLAEAGSDQRVTTGVTVTLDGTNSQDPDGTITSVQWQQIAGNIQVALTTPYELTTKFTAPAVNSDEDTLTFRLTIKDNDDLVSEDNVNVTITPTVVSAANSGRNGSGGGGCFIEVIMH